MCVIASLNTVNAPLLYTEVTSPQTVFLTQTQLINLLSKGLRQQCHEGTSLLMLVICPKLGFLLRAAHSFMLKRTFK